VLAVGLPVRESIFNTRRESLQNIFHHLARGICIKDNKVLLAQATGYTNTFLPGGHIEKVFEVESDEFVENINPKSIESHLNFFWCNADELSIINLQPYPLSNLIKKYLNGNKEIWWESTLNAEIDDSNRN
jgi:8-oxo-dGTP diphosphatase